MTICKPIEAGSGFLKASIFGAAGSGKTTTAVKLALGTRKFLGLKGPLYFFDTENGSPWAAKAVMAETGLDLVGVKSRSFDDLVEFLAEAQAAGASVAVVDSLTHCWEELNATYLRRINDARRADRRTPIDRLEFQHMAAIKQMWGRWTAAYLNSPLHVVTCGRVANEWEMQDDERGRKQLVKTGVRFQAEKQFGHEASILAEMESVETLDGDRVSSVTHRIFVIKDRNMDPATSLVGRSCDDPGFEFFAPHVAVLTGAHAPVDVGRETAINVDAEGNSEWQRERRAREIVLEELRAALDVAGHGGTSGDAKKARAELLLECFGTASALAMESIKSETLRQGFARLRERLAALKGAAA